MSPPCEIKLAALFIDLSVSTGTDALGDFFFPVLIQTSGDAGRGPADRSPTSRQVGLIWTTCL